MDQPRFRDPMVHLTELAAEIIDVVCPRCGARAASVPRPTESRWIGEWPRRLVCAGCGHARTRPAGSTSWGGPIDPFFALPLWLQTECCGGRLLWAYNRTHLDLLEEYVAAELRERGVRPGSSVLTRLPAWIKAAKHREEVLRTIRRLRATLPA
jgi:hypothetical protein